MIFNTHGVKILNIKNIIFKDLKDGDANSVLRINVAIYWAVSSCFLAAANGASGNNWSIWRQFPDQLQVWNRR